MSQGTLEKHHSKIPYELKTMKMLGSALHNYSFLSWDYCVGEDCWADLDTTGT